ncbi:hypothetical protein FXF51_33375 [Nonomuraea sp. PA05]|uniref:hypothetical protein n=1 Tax=Nonomuraea sp. PA05 TaxID=2604466 RepID=UPI0011D41405|nr:hypothetical protein [Nonomuraea sp. PA05]TYB59898.1 hypothetical protein FXF51_33375 [Nonomuraea sp. PA05]
MSAESTDLFVGTPGEPRQVLRVTVAEGAHESSLELRGAGVRLAGETTVLPAAATFEVPPYREPTSRNHDREPPGRAQNREPTHQTHDREPHPPDHDLLRAARRKAFARWLDDLRARRVRLMPGLEHPGDPRQPDNHHKH